LACSGKVYGIVTFHQGRSSGHPIHSCLLWRKKSIVTCISASIALLHRVSNSTIVVTMPLRRECLLVNVADILVQKQLDVLLKSGLVHHSSMRFGNLAISIDQQRHWHRIDAVLLRQVFIADDHRVV
jgi:hypothetical protein